MKLWILKANKKVLDWDSFDSFVVKAQTERDAREIAQENGATECDIGTGYNIKRGPFWLESQYSSCKELKPTGKPGIVLGSFNAG